MKVVAPAIALTVMGIGGYAVGDLHAIVNPPATDTAGLQAHETHAAASLLGQFRTSMSSWLWLRTDLYLHNGVEMRQMTDMEKDSGVRSEDAADDGNKKLMDESTVLTIIPSKDRDFRGIFGDIERATNAYKDMHNHMHNDPTTALPLFRLMTWIDPTFIPGWVTGASVISRDHSKAGTLKAVEYLKQGLENNPRSISILMEIGELYITRMGNLKKAIGYLQQARQIGHHREWIMDNVEKDSLQQCYRWIALCYRDLGQNERMRAAAFEGLQLFKDDIMLMKLLNPPPIIFTPDHQRSWLLDKNQELMAGHSAASIDID